MAEQAYVTMLFTDDYLRGMKQAPIDLMNLITIYLGAQVLAASLRDGGTTKKLAVMVPSDPAHLLLPQTIIQLEVYLIDESF